MRELSCLSKKFCCPSKQKITVSCKHRTRNKFNNIVKLFVSKRFLFAYFDKNIFMNFISNMFLIFRISYVTEKNLNNYFGKF